MGTLNRSTDLNVAGVTPTGSRSTADERLPSNCGIDRFQTFLLVVPEEAKCFGRQGHGERRTQACRFHFQVIGSAISHDFPAHGRGLGILVVGFPEQEGFS
jgi:hypothetical protein